MATSKTTHTNILPVERLYTTPGVHPYDQIEWEKRDVIQTNWKSGTVVFEQKGVEFPTFWSHNASTIVTTKYFRGAPGSVEREYSLKQLVNRVVDTYVTAAKEHGYITNPEDLEIFDHELKYMLINQVFSFNSPVWFNVGTSSPQQVSACQPHHSIVNTPDGDIPIGRIVEQNMIGLEVYDAAGLTHVVAVKHNGVKAVLRLHTEEGHHLDVTGDHLVWKDNGDSGAGLFVPAGQMQPGDMMSCVHTSFDVDSKSVQITLVEPLGEMDVYDIQTSSGEYLSSGNLRVHNCFILAVDDTMDSILNWYREEGLIFKGGSGAGLNLSRIRSSKELLASSGGTASGPVSFMRGADASAGTIKSGGATRRAAKMVVLDVDHPDIVQFVETKAKEEEKIRVLRDAGFDMDLGGEDIVSVQYQNANNSVRVSDEFMQAVKDGNQFGLRARTTGDIIDTVDAKALFRKIAEAAWACADPGVQYDDTINHWHTNPEAGRITASNPCSEYLSLDNSSCNLASLNLMKFREEDGSFNVDRFVRAVEYVITAMEISISFADFPTEAIGETTRNFRQLGIGFANLGAFLMASGLAYDSGEGRALASSITSLMTGAAYRRSAEIAGIVGPYNGYVLSKDGHQRVMRQHEEAAQNLHNAVRGIGKTFYVAEHVVAQHDLSAPIAEKAVEEWSTGIFIGALNGWRNAQASVLAPTGTIGFMMDVDTTGVEPDFSLLKFKKMVGGGSLEIVNQRVADALFALKYSTEIVEAIEEFIAEHGHVIGAPGLKEKDYAVFDCAIGERSISPMGHINMMAAVQPFLSGAISKTVNLPETATIEEIEKVYYDGWVLGLKAIAVYRDNCKVGQPLSGSKDRAVEVVEPKIVERVVEKIVERPIRRRLPKTRDASTTSFTVSGAEGYLTTGKYDDGTLGEVFVKMSKQGSTLAGIMDAFSIAVSLGLQYGVPLDAFVAKFTNMRFEPSGMTDDPDIRMAQSLLDYMFRRVALNHMPYEERAAYGIYTTVERTEAVNDGGYDNQNSETATPPPQDEIAPKPKAETVVDKNRGTLVPKTTLKIEAPLCITCGTAQFMVRSGSCFACTACGGTSGCS